MNYHRFSTEHIHTAYNTQLVFPENIRLGLVCEGGGQRGVFTAGVLDAFMEHQFDPFGGVFGVSAGAQCAASFVSQQYRHAFHVITQLTDHELFYQPRNWFRNEDLLNLDWYFDMCEKNSNFMLDLEQFVDQKRLHVIAADANTMTAETIIPSDYNLTDALKASSALPFFYRDGVQMNNKQLVDGGVAAPVPVRIAADHGFNVLVVIRTTHSGGSHLMNISSRFYGIFEKRSRGPRIADMMIAHEDNYDKDQNFLRNPPKGTLTIEITPGRSMSTRLIGSDSQKLHDDYQMGLNTGALFVNTLGRQISEALTMQSQETKTKNNSWLSRVFSHFQ